MARPKVLYIDDEAVNLSNFKVAFEDEFDILLAHSGEEGMAIFDREEEIAVVVSDQRMPGISGVDVLQEVRKKSPDTIRLVLTAYTAASDLIDAINRGQVHRYIVKPWDENELRMSLKNAACTYKLTRNNRRLVKELELKNTELGRMNMMLEEIVTARTMELLARNETLTRRNEELNEANMLIIQQKKELQWTNQRLTENVADLEKATAHIEILQNLLPVCSYCKKIRQDKGAWTDLEKYFHDKMALRFTHSICPSCYVTHVQPQLEASNIPSTWIPTEEDYDRGKDLPGDGSDEKKH